MIIINIMKQLYKCDEYFKGENSEKLRECLLKYFSGYDIVQACTKSSVVYQKCNDEDFWKKVVTLKFGFKTKGDYDLWEDFLRDLKYGPNDLLYHKALIIAGIEDVEDVNDLLDTTMYANIEMYFDKYTYAGERIDDVIIEFIQNDIETNDLDYNDLYPYFVAEGHKIFYNPYSDTFEFEDGDESNLIKVFVGDLSESITDEILEAALTI